MIQQITTYFSEHGAEWIQMIIDHLAISGMALAAALAIAVPLGILCSQHAWSERLATGTAGVLRVIPSLAILIICVPYLGVGTGPAGGAGAAARAAGGEEKVSRYKNKRSM